MNSDKQPLPPASRLLTFVLLLLPLLILLPAFFGIPFASPQAEYTDLLVSHYPNALYLRRSLLQEGTIPLWSPTILSGYPFAANPLSGLWYPPGWLALLFPLNFGFTLLVGLHLIWGGVGMYRFLRREGLRHVSALFGSLSFALMPKLYAHYGAGHLTLLYAIAWTPWLLLAGRDKKRKWASGVVLALIFLADPRWAAYAGLLWLAYLLSYSQYNRKQKTLGVLTSLGITACLIAPLLVPLLEYTSLSTRSDLTPAEVFSHSLPPAQLLGLFFPSGGGSTEWVAYAGGAGLVFAVLALLLPRVRRKTRFWLWVAGLSLIFSLGSHLPGLALLARLPGLSLLRVPPRALFLLGTAFAALTGYVLEELLAETGDSFRRCSVNVGGIGRFSRALGGWHDRANGRTAPERCLGGRFFAVGCGVGYFRPGAAFSQGVVGGHFFGSGTRLERRRAPKFQRSLC